MLGLHEPIISEAIYNLTQIKMRERSEVWRTDAVCETGQKRLKAVLLFQRWLRSIHFFPEAGIVMEKKMRGVEDLNEGLNHPQNAKTTS